MSDYIPINCSYYDELEAIATLRRQVEVIYYADDHLHRLSRVRIKDLFTKNKEEYIVLDSGHTIRLDHLVKVDGKPVVYGC